MSSTAAGAELRWAQPQSHGATEPRRNRAAIRNLLTYAPGNRCIHYKLPSHRPVLFKQNYFALPFHFTFILNEENPL